jgi:hypothetical protein
MSAGLHESAQAPRKKTLAGEIILSLKAGALLVVSGRVSGIVPLTPGHQAPFGYLEAEPEAFMDGPARVACVLSLPYYLKGARIDSHPFLHLRSDGLRPEDLMLCRLHEEWATQVLSNRGGADVGYLIEPARMDPRLVALAEKQGMAAPSDEAGGMRAGRR